MEELRNVTLRNATPVDDDLLYSFYAERRAAEIASFQWGEAEATSFLRSQFDLRRAAYLQRYPRSQFVVIEIDGVPAGELIICELPGYTLLVDIVVAERSRGQGIGTAVITDLQKMAADAGHAIVLHVDRVNVRAQRLYEKLGFSVADGIDQISIEMRWSTELL